MTVRKIVIRFCNNIRHFSNEINKRGGGILFCGGWNFSKSVSVGPTFIREMRVVFGEQCIILNLFCSAVPKVSKVMVTTGSPRTSATKTEIINVDYGYAGGPCKGCRTFQPRNFKPRP